MSATAVVGSLMMIACGSPGDAKSAPDTHAAKCAGYECTETGARALLSDIARNAGLQIQGEIAVEFGRVVEQAVHRMRSRGFTSDNFILAGANLRRFLAESPPGMESNTARQLERLRRGLHAICPLWPFC